MSMGMFLIESVISPVPTCFVNEISASSRIPSKPHKVQQDFRLTSKNAAMPVVLGCLCPFDAFLKQCILRYRKEHHIRKDQFRQSWLLVVLNFLHVKIMQSWKTQLGGPEFQSLNLQHFHPCSAKMCSDLQAITCKNLLNILTRFFFQQNVSYISETASNNTVLDKACLIAELMSGPNKSSFISFVLMSSTMEARFSSERRISCWQILLWSKVYQGV